MSRGRSLDLLGRVIALVAERMLRSAAGPTENRVSPLVEIHLIRGRQRRDPYQA